jgi:hypothetical protein
MNFFQFLSDFSLIITLSASVVRATPLAASLRFSLRLSFVLLVDVARKLHRSAAQGQAAVPGLFSRRVCWSPLMFDIAPSRATTTRLVGNQSVGK